MVSTSHPAAPTSVGHLGPLVAEPSGLQHDPDVSRANLTGVVPDIPQEIDPIEQLHGQEPVLAVADQLVEA